jgi:hypothetical protein
MSVGDRQRAGWLCGAALVSLTFSAGWNVGVTEVLTYIGPVVRVAEGGVQFIETKVAQ